MIQKRFSRLLSPHWVPIFEGAEPPDWAWYDVDVDQYWEKVLRMDFETEFIHELAEAHFWQVTLVHMDLSEQAKQDFRKSFFSPSAREGRQRAIHGTKGFNRMDEAHLIKAAKAIQDAMFDDVDTGEQSVLIKDEDGREWDTERIGQAFVRMVVAGNSEAFSKISELLKTRTLTGKAPPEVVFEKNFGKAWRGFCQYVRENQSIPTKLRFKWVAGFHEEPHGDSNGNKAMRKLGLSGLPQ